MVQCSLLVETIICESCTFDKSTNCKVLIFNQNFANLPLTLQHHMSMGSELNRFKVISNKDVAYNKHGSANSGTQIVGKIADIPSIIFQTDLTGHYTYISKAWEEHTDISIKDAIGKHFTEFLSPELRLQFNNKVRKDSPYSDYLFEFDYMLKGQVRKLKTEFNKLRNHDGEHIGYIGTFFDLTELRNTRVQLLKEKDLLEHQEERIKANLAELERKNLELNKFISKNLEIENFAYIASHDLKAPLRSVMSFSLLLKKKYYELLDEKGQKYLDIISDASQDMIRLIDGLLKYTTIHGSENNLRTVDVGYLIDESLLTLHSAVEQAEAIIGYGPMPQELIVDKDKIYQLFYIIIDNSIKFRHPQRIPSIRIESEELVDHWLFRITDNGIGIPLNFNLKAFDLFKKVKTTGSDTGTGVGLTIAQTIVNQHGGKIWIESTEGEGMVVCFTLKK